MHRRCLISLAGAWPLAGVAAAATPEAAAVEAPVVLSVEGQVAGGERHFTLEALGTEALHTTTPWTVGVQAFSGVPAARLLEACGVRHASALHAEALNRYVVALEPDDVWKHAGLLATRLAGQPMRVRERGPVWLVFPWSARPELNRPERNERSIWQLRRIKVG